MEMTRWKYTVVSVADSERRISLIPSSDLVVSICNLANNVAPIVRELRF